MIKRYKFIIIINFLFFILFTTSCGNTSPAMNNPKTVAEAEAARAKDLKKKQKIAKKEQKKAEKDFWKLQSKDAKKRIRKTKRKLKKKGRKRYKRDLYGS